MRKVNIAKDGLPVFDSSRDDLPVYYEEATYEIRIYDSEAAGEPSVYRPWLPGIQAMAFVASYNHHEKLTGRRAEAHLIPGSMPQDELCETA